MEGAGDEVRGERKARGIRDSQPDEDLGSERREYRDDQSSHDGQANSIDAGQSRTTLGLFHRRALVADRHCRSGSPKPRVDEIVRSCRR